MGSDIVKPVKRLVRSIEKRGIMIGVGTDQPLYVTSDTCFQKSLAFYYRGYMVRNVSVIFW